MSRRPEIFNHAPVLHGTLDFFNYVSGIEGVLGVTPRGKRDRSPGIDKIEIHLVGYDDAHCDLMGEIRIPHEGSQHFKLRMRKENYAAILGKIRDKYTVIDDSK
jgi:hypothetical protein